LKIVVIIKKNILKNINLKISNEYKLDKVEIKANDNHNYYQINNNKNISNNSSANL